MRPRKARDLDAEDDAPVVVDEAGEVLSAAEVARMEGGGGALDGAKRDGEKGESEGNAVDDRGKGEEGKERAGVKEVVASIGGAGKARKRAIKAVGGEDGAEISGDAKGEEIGGGGREAAKPVEAEGLSGDPEKPRKKAKKAKKVKLSFDEG